MSSDYSRLIFDRKKHYSAVRMQQGRVLLDSDWNAQSDIYQDRLHKQTIDVIGKTGVPTHSNGFQLSLHSDSELSISAGRMYVDGLLCEVDEPLIFGITNDGMVIPNVENGQPNAFIHTAMTTGRYLLYLQAWQREVTYLDDPIIREKALGDPDTTTRLQTAWHIKAVTIDQGLQCEDIQFPLNDIGMTGSGTLEARTISSDSNTDPCSFNQTGGFRRLENQLYRIEIQKGGPLADATFKWSRENSSVVTNVSEIVANDSVRVDSLGRDEVLGFSVGDWVEFQNNRTSLDRTVGQLLQIMEINRSTMEIGLSGAVDSLDPQGLKMIRWDQNVEDIPLNSTFVPIEDGIEVNFSSGNYITGDYWLIPARTIDSSIEWPIGTRKQPNGVQISVAKIAIVEVLEGEIQSISDCRSLFPPLTELPNIGGGCCTYHVKPIRGWEKIFDRIKERENAKICFDIGVYSLEQTLTIKNKGHLLLLGCGQGTNIDASKLQVAFRFETCASVDISQMSFQTEQVNNQQKDDVVSRKGAITIVNTPLLSIDKLYISCGHGLKAKASCITYYNDEKNPGDLYISNCRLSVGFYQHGIVVVNSHRSVIENNVITVPQKPEKLSLRKRIRGDNRTRNSFMDILMSKTAEEPNSNTNQTIVYGNHSLSFRTNSDLRNADVWQTLLKKYPPPATISSIRDLKEHMKNTALNIVVAKERGHIGLDRFVDSLREEDPSVGFQGIVIGGKVSSDVHVNGNRIEDFLQGIHIGLSHRKATSSDTDIINAAKIRNNYVRNTLPILSNYSRHGIFVGNCERLVIESNQLELKRMSRANKITIDAIRVWGHLGRKGTIVDNDIYSTIAGEKSYSNGIRVENLEQQERTVYWNISWNSIIASQKLQLEGNFFNKYFDTNY